MSHAHIYEHLAHCPTKDDAEAHCVCERARYQKVFFIGITFAAAEYIAGTLSGSSALHADALHLFADATSDFAAILITTIVASLPEKEGLFRRYGGYLQAFLLCLVGILVIIEGLEKLSRVHVVHAETMIVVGMVATGVNWWRFRVLHEGNPFVLLWHIAKAAFSGSRQLTTFIGEVFHILTDVGMSIAAIIGGVSVLYFKDDTLDIGFSIGMAIAMICSAFVVIIFAGREHDHHH